jgi:predicted transposase YbfD/YdcC
MRYYILSAKKSAEEFNKKVRSHSQVETKLQGILDITMNEDGDKNGLKNPLKTILFSAKWL